MKLTHPLVSWCRKCRSSKDWAEFLLIHERDMAILGPSLGAHLGSRERYFLSMQVCGQRMDYIARRLAITLRQAEEIEAQLIEAALPRQSCRCTKCRARQIVAQRAWRQAAEERSVAIQVEGNVIRLERAAARRVSP